MEWFSRLPPKLQKSAYIYRHEAAWSKEDALETIEALSALGAAVLGVEVWLRTDGAPRIPSPFTYQWDAGPQKTTDLKRSAIDTNAVARDYVRRFQWDPHDVGVQEQQPYFNLTV
jgi:hypothetical protein